MTTPLPAGANPKQIVADGYDAIGNDFVEEARKDPADLWKRYIRYLTDGFLGCSDVLDLGCGAGDPGTKMLSIYFDVTGVDISPGQIARARTNVPNANFMLADITEVKFPTESFDGVTAFYSIIHVQRELHPGLIENIAGWLRVGGRFIGTFHHRAHAEDYNPDWFGAPMFWSGYGPEDNQLMVEAAGLKIITANIENIPIDVDGSASQFQMIVAEKVQK